MNVRSPFARRSVRHSSRRSGRLRRAVSGVTVGALVAAGTAGLLAPPASAATLISQGEGEFLAGSILGSDLDPVLNLQSALAENFGGATVVDPQPLDVAVLNAVNVQLAASLPVLPGTQLLNLGAANQVAIANPDGSSLGASGLVTDAGAIDVNGSTTPGAPGTASINVTPLLTGPTLGLLSDLRVDVGALSAVATQAPAAGAQTGDYNIAGLSLAFTSVALGSTVNDLVTTVNALQPTVDALPALIRAIPAVGALAVIDGVPDLSALTAALTSVTAANGAITANLRTGAITVDVAALLNYLLLDLNDLPVGADVLQYVAAALTSELLPAVTDALTGLVTQITSAINSISVTVVGLPVALGVLAPVLNPAIATVTAPITALVADIGSTVVAPLVGVLGDVLGITANNQETSAGTFTETALRVALLPVLEPDTLVLDLAAGSVGPNSVPAPALTVDTAGPFAPGTVSPVLPSVETGSQVDYTVTVTNGGSADAPGGATIVDYIPIGAHVISTAAPAGVTCTTDTDTTYPGERLICTLADPLAIDASVTITLTLEVLPQALAAGTIANQAATTPTGAGEPSDLPQADCAEVPNCDSTAPTPVTAPPIALPSFTQTKTADRASYLPGEAITYTITVANGGDATGSATVLDDVPAAVVDATTTCVGPLPADALCSASIVSGALTATVTVPAGQSVSIRISGTVSPTVAAGELANTAFVTPVGPDCTTPGVCGGGPTNPVDPGVSPVPAFSQTKTADQGSYLPGEAITYTITVANGGGAAGTASVTDVLPLGLLNPVATCVEPLPADASCAAPIETGALMGAVAVPAGASVSIAISGTVGPDAVAGQLDNVATVTPSGPDCTTPGVDCGGGPTDPVTPSILPIPDFTQTKTADQASYLPGQAITYTITVVNEGDATGAATVTDALPAGIVAPVASCTLSLPAGALCDAAVIGGALAATVTVPAGASVSITVSGAVSSTVAPGDLANTAVVTPTGPDCTTPGVDCGGGPTEPVDPGIGDVPHFTQTKTTDQPSYLPGEDITYTITVGNNGGAAGAATVADVLPAGLVAPVAACGPLDAGESCEASIVAGALAATVGVPAGGSVSITISGSVSPTVAAGALANIAVVTPTGPDCATPGVDCGGGPTDPVDPGVRPIPFFTQTKSADQPSYLPGEAITYTITVANDGDGVGTANVLDILPSGVTGASATCQPNTLAEPCSATIIAGSLSGTATVLAGSSVTFVVTGAVSAAAAAGDLANIAVVTPTGPDCATPGVDCGGGPTDPVDPDVQPIPFFTQTKSADQPSYLPGEAITYTITVGNNGGAAGAATVADVLPAGLVAPVAACGPLDAGESCEASIVAGALAATVGVPAGGSVSITISGSVSPTVAAGALANIAVVTPTGPDCATPGVDCGGGPTDPVDPGVRPIPFFTGVETTDKIAYVPGGAITYEVIVSNTGSVSGMAQFRNLLPVGLEGVSASTVTCAPVGSGTGTCGEITATDVGGNPLALAEPGDQVAIALTIPAGQSIRVTISGTVALDAVQGDLDDSSTITPTDAACATPGVDCGNRDTNTVVPLVLPPVLPFFTQDKTSDEASYQPGEAITYTITVANEGGAAGTATVTDHLPSGIVDASAICGPVAPGTGSCDVAIVDGTVTALVSVPAGEAVQVVITGTVATDVAVGDLANVGTVTPTEPSCLVADADCGGGTTDPVDPGVDAASGVSVTLTVSPSAPSPGAPVAYTVATRNGGPDDATNVVVTLPVPAAVLDPRGTADPGILGGACLTRATTQADLALMDQASGPYTLASHPSTVVCTYPVLPVGATAVTRVSGTLDPATAAGSVLVAQVLAMSDQFDPDLSDNRAVALSGGTLSAAASPPGSTQSGGSRPGSLPMTPGKGLASTGVEARDQLALVVILVLLGAALVGVGARRKSSR